VNQALQQLSEGTGAQQLELTFLGFAQQGVVATHLLGELRQSGLQCAYFGAQLPYTFAVGGGASRVWMAAHYGSGTPLCHTAAVLQVIASLAHQSLEGIRILRDDRRANPFDRLRQGFERLCSVIIETLDFVIQLRALLSDPG